MYDDFDQQNIFDGDDEDEFGDAISVLVRAYEDMSDSIMVIQDAQVKMLECMRALSDRMVRFMEEHSD